MNRMQNILVPEPKSAVDKKHGKVVFQNFENYKYIKNINYSKAGTPKGSLKATMVEPASKFKLKNDVVSIPMLNFESMVPNNNKDSENQKGMSPRTQLAKKFYTKYIISPLDTTLSIRKQ